MRTLTKTINIFSFNELSKESQNKAIIDMIEFLVECSEDPIILEAVEAMESLRTPWFTVEFIYDNNKEEIIEYINSNEYEFLENGVIFNEDEDLIIHG